jgi:hypothetical protein
LRYYSSKVEDLSEKFPSCTSETIKAGPFKIKEKIFLPQETA